MELGTFCLPEICHLLCSPGNCPLRVDFRCGNSGSWRLSGFPNFLISSERTSGKKQTVLFLLRTGTEESPPGVLICLWLQPPLEGQRWGWSHQFWGLLIKTYSQAVFSPCSTPTGTSTLIPTLFTTPQSSTTVPERAAGASTLHPGQAWGKKEHYPPFWKYPRLAK